MVREFCKVGKEWRGFVEGEEVELVDYSLEFSILEGGFLVCR